MTFSQVSYSLRVIQETNVSYAISCWKTIGIQFKMPGKSEKLNCTPDQHSKKLWKFM